MSYKSYRRLLAFFLIIICGLIYFLGFKSITELSDKETGLNTIQIAEPKPLEADRQDVMLTDASDADELMVIPCGEPIGIYVKSKGVMVIDVGDIKDIDNNIVTPCRDKLEPGDYITAVNGVELEDKKQLIEYVLDSSGKSILLDVLRNEQKIKVSVNPVSTEDGYKLGIWVKDDISGIGTITYINQEGFGALGHSINDNDTGSIFRVSDGAIYSANIINIIKSSNNCPGRLEGIIDYSSKNILGRIKNNTSCGIEGYMTKKGIQVCDTGEWMPVASKGEVHRGNAYLLSYVSGEKEYYSIEISGVDVSKNTDGKCIELKVTDERLIELTGGIVQGMSGTPIIQDGKLVGAVTHVFVKDSTRGYGIFAMDMLK